MCVFAHMDRHVSSKGRYERTNIFIYEYLYLYYVFIFICIHMIYTYIFYIYMYIYIYIHKYIYKYTWIYIYIYLCKFVQINRHVFPAGRYGRGRKVPPSQKNAIYTRYVYVNVSAYENRCIYMYIYICVYTYTYTYT
jgi:hypothetical protein